MLSIITTFDDDGDPPAVTVFNNDLKVRVPAGCLLGRSDGFKPWDNPYDLISHQVSMHMQRARIKKEFQLS